MYVASVKCGFIVASFSFKTWSLSLHFEQRERRAVPSENQYNLACLLVYTHNDMKIPENSSIYIIYSVFFCVLTKHYLLSRFCSILSVLYEVIWCRYRTSYRICFFPPFFYQYYCHLNCVKFISTTFIRCLTRREFPS